MSHVLMSAALAMLFSYIAVAAHDAVEDSYKHSKTMIRTEKAQAASVDFAGGLHVASAPILNQSGSVLATIDAHGNLESDKVRKQVALSAGPGHMEGDQTHVHIISHPAHVNATSHPSGGKVYVNNKAGGEVHVYNAGHGSHGEGKGKGDGESNTGGDGDEGKRTGEGSGTAEGGKQYPDEHLYVAVLSELDSSGVHGKVAVFVTPSDLRGVGSLKGLEPNLDVAADCTATNGCGVHVHSGSSCADSGTQGGHYFHEGPDPWKVVRHAGSDSLGHSNFAFDVATRAKDVEDKAFVVHDSAGKRVACGVLSKVWHPMSARLEGLDTGDVTGFVTVWTSEAHMYGAGWARGLEGNLKAVSSGGSDCAATNGCGLHVHSGSSCHPKKSQGGHLMNKDDATDPWAAIRYSFTNNEGSATFMFSVATDNTGIKDKPFIVHSNDGGRVACGLLRKFSTCPPPPAHVR